MHVAIDGSNRDDVLVAEEESKRLVHQRVRNRVIEALEVLADADAGLFTVGVSDYFNVFFDNVDDDLPYDWRELCTYTTVEIEKIERVLTVMLEALAATAHLDTEDEFAGSGWPRRIAPSARDALATMLSRGRFDEEHEEDEPTRR